MRARSCDHSAKRARSSGGTPSISAITITGRGPATARIRSKPAGSSTASRSSCITVRMCGSRASTTRGVNAWLTSDRSRVWSGGSRNSIVQSARGGTARRRRRSGGTLSGRFEKRRKSRRIASTSA